MREQELQDKIADLLVRRFRDAELATDDRYEPDYDQLTQFAGFIITTLNTDPELANQLHGLRSVPEQVRS